MCLFVPQLVASEFRRGHTVLLRDASHRDMTVFGKVLGVVKNGASSYLTVTLVEADDNGTLTDLSDADQILIAGSSNPEGGPMPDAISYDPVKISNFTQIFRTSLEITRTAKKTFLLQVIRIRKKSVKHFSIMGLKWNVLSGGV